MRVFLLWISCLCTIGNCMAQQFEDQASFQMDVSQLERFHLYNRRGAVTVKATNGKTATLKVKRSLTAKSSSRLEEVKKEIYLDSMRKDGHLVFFVQHPNLKLKFDDDYTAGYESINQNWWDSNSGKDHVKVRFTITLEIPAQTDLTVRNHEHPLSVDGMKGDLKAANHHDGVVVKNQGGSADVHSHHGDVEVFYTKNPSRECHYDTHHGDIRVHYQKGLSADASMYSYHGSFYSAFDWSPSPMKVSKQSGKGAKYRVSSKSQTNVKISSGGPAQSFRTHHGDIYLLDQ